jgi:hypothetical protein
MEHTLLVMAVTALADGVCVACVNENRQWVRPTRQQRPDWRQLHVADLKDETGRVVVQAGNEVRWEVGPPAPHAVHTEDAFVGHRAPQLARALGYVELLAWCEYLRRPDLRAFLSSTDRSLMLCRPAHITRAQFSASGKGGITARLRFECEGDAEDFSVTDLRWRALGRELLARRGAKLLNLSEFELRRQAGIQVRYLAIGRGQAWEEKLHPLAGAHWPFVINVFTDPPLTQEVDYANL